MDLSAAFFVIQNNIPKQCSIFCLIIYSLQMGERWNLSLLEGMTRLLDDEKMQKRRGKEEDSDITGGRYSEDVASF